MDSCTWRMISVLSGSSPGGGWEFFFFTIESRPALRPTQPPIQWVQEAPSLGVKRPGREADHSPPSCAKVKNAWSYTSTPLCFLTEHNAVKAYWGVEV
jgi:hypothetical protein